MSNKNIEEDFKLSPFEAGYYAGYNQEGVECPYPPDTDEANEWWDGFREGERADSL